MEAVTESGNERYVGRQPICDARLRLHAYELLFREGDVGHANVVDSDAASSSTIITSLTEIGLFTLTGGHPAFVNVTKRLLLSGLVELLDPSTVVLELLEDVEIDAELVATLARLRGLGYEIALDDFTYSTEALPLLEVATYVKLDALALSPAELERHVSLLAPFGVKLLAEKVETWETFYRNRELGFDYFQGFFFCRPTNVRGGPVTAGRLGRMRLAAALQRETLEVEELRDLIRQDLGLSYRLLRLVNSVSVGRRHRIDTIERAIAMLGPRRVALWATLLTLAGLDDCPAELIVTAMLRGQVCRLIGSSAGLDADRCFTVGLFSALDALLGVPMQQAVAELPLAREITRALVERSGGLGELLGAVLAHEDGEIELGARLSGGDSALTTLYLEALAWVEESRALLARAA
jgi:EAL and modified HD-GYP domain-containing signal transduction protein